jgi:hypothetical protein
MDKVIFFDSLSFLTKFATDVWPPKVTSFSAYEVSCDPGFNLSVEVDEGPILLKSDNKDPAMFICDLIVLEPLLGSPSSASTSLSQGTPKSTTKRIGSQDVVLENALHKQQLVLRLDQTQTYRVDSSQVLDIILQKGNRSLPASIVIQFQECSFRFFSAVTASDRLQAACQKLQKLPQISFSSENLEQMSQSQAIKSTKRKLRSLEKGRQDLVDAILHQKRPTSPSKVCHQLDTAALSISYASTYELELAVVSQRQCLESTQMELEDLLTAYFPRAKLRRSESDSRHQPPMEESIQIAYDLQQKQYSHLEQRHELAFLPFRG